MTALDQLIIEKTKEEIKKQLKSLYKDRENAGAFGWAFDYDEKIEKLEKQLKEWSESNE